MNQRKHLKGSYLMYVTFIPLREDKKRKKEKTNEIIKLYLGSNQLKLSKTEFYLL